MADLPSVSWLVRRARGVTVAVSPGRLHAALAEAGIEARPVEAATLTPGLSVDGADVVLVDGGFGDVARIDRLLAMIFEDLAGDGELAVALRPSDGAPIARTISALLDLSEVIELEPMGDGIAVAVRPGSTPKKHRVAHLAAALAALDEARLRLDHDLEGTRSDQRRLSSEATELRQSLDIMTRDRDSLADDFRRSTDALSERLSESEGELTRRLEEVRRLEGQLASAESKGREQSQRINELESEAAKAARLTDDLDRSRRYARSLEGKVGNLEDRQRQLDDSIKGYRARIERQHKSKTEAQNQLAQARHSLRVMQNRKWWKIHEILRRDIRRPLRIPLIPLRWLKVIFGPSYSEDAPTPKPFTPAFAPPAAAAAESAPSVAPAASAAQATEVPIRQRLLAPSREPRPDQFRVAAILDEMSRASFAPECELITFRPDNWKETLERTEPHMLLVESAWQGNGGSWQYQVGTYAHSESVGLPHLSALVSWCQQQGVPTVFWNKEDPVHFEKFKEAAALFDVVFTTDENAIDRYKALGNSRISTFGALPFAAQPRLHHPIGSIDRLQSACFAGTFYRNRHTVRQGQLEMLLDAALPHGLVIYDRMHGSESDAFGFPDRFQEAIRGSVTYDEMVDIYRDHRIFLNTNSVTDSPTMFSRRVFELLGCGTPVVSTPSVGVEQLFGDLIPVVDDPLAAKEALDALMTDADLWRARSHAGIARVQLGHTYAHRLDTIATAAGFQLADPNPATAWIAEAQHEADVRNLLDQLAAADAGISELVVVWTGPDAPPDSFGPDETVIVVTPNSVAAAAGRSTVDRFFTGSLEGADRLVAAAVYTDADLIGVATDEGAAYTYGAALDVGNVLMTRRAFERGWVPGAEAARAGATTFGVPAS